MTTQNTMGIKDQYGDEIPADLVCLSGFTPDEFTKAELQTIDHADWFEWQKQIFVSFAAAPCLAEGEDFWDYSQQYLDGGNNIADGDICRIADCLKRWSVEDGFYHA